MPSGQYEFPFSIKLHNEMPSSFRIRLRNNEVFELKYLIKVYFDTADPVVWAQKEVTILKHHESLLRYMSGATSEAFDWRK